MLHSRLWAWLCLALALLVAAGPAHAAKAEFRLELAPKSITIDGRTTNALTINGTLPGPLLRFREGDDVVIHVTNRMKDLSALHWHGLLVPPGMDGVPGLGGIKGIAPGETFTYRFKARQSVTYW